MEIKDFKKRYEVKTYGELKKLELTDEQYKRLVYLMQLGIHTISEFNDEKGKGIQDIEQYIWSFSRQFNATELVDYEPVIDMYVPSETLKNENKELLAEHDQNIFLFKLVRKLADRDRNLSGYSPESEINSDLEIQYITEYEKHGVKNLFLKNDKE
jgi:hypothetical protein